MKSALFCALLAVPAAAQTNNLFQYLRLNSIQIDAITSNVSAYGDALNQTAAQVIALNLNLNTVERAASGQARVAIENLCRGAYSTAQQLYQDNNAILTDAQRTRLAQVVLAGRQTAIVAQAQDVHFLLADPPPSGGVAAFYGVAVPPNHEMLIAYLQLTTDQLDQLTALEASYSDQSSEIFDPALSDLLNALEELGHPVPDLMVVGSLYADMEYRQRQLKTIGLQTIQDHRALLTADQLARLDALSPARVLAPLAILADQYFLTPVTPARPASTLNPLTVRTCAYSDAMSALLTGPNY